MRCEINKDFYCSANGYIADGTCFFPVGDRLTKCDLHRPELTSDRCRNLHRKHPTPEQFKEEYGEEWTGAIYSKCFDGSCINTNCIYAEWTDFPDFALPGQDQDGCHKQRAKVCACTPFGKPDADWRPE
jgi:hypothetical protein